MLNNNETTVKNTYNEDDLINKEIPELYEIISQQAEEQYDSKEEMEKERKNFRKAMFKLLFKAFCETLFISKEKGKKLNDKFIEIEKWFLDKVDLMLSVDIDEPLQEKLDNGELEQKGLLVYTNHHGGGLETFCSRNILHHIKHAPARWALKSGLTKIPLYGNVVKKSKPIIIERENPGEDDSSYKEKLAAHGLQIATALENNEIVVIAFEGTRSLNGDIVEHPKYKNTAITLDIYTQRAIKEHAEEFKDLDFNKVLMTVDTFAALSEPIEKKPSAKTRLKGGIRAFLELLPEKLSLKPPKYPAHVIKTTEDQQGQAPSLIKPILNNEEVIEKLMKKIEEREGKIKDIRAKTNNIFGYSRTRLKKMLIEQIMEKPNK